MEKINNKRTNHQNQKPGKLSFPHFTEQERLDELKNNPSLYRKFQQLNEPWKKAFSGFYDRQENSAAYLTTRSLRNCSSLMFIRNDFPV